MNTLTTQRASFSIPSIVALAAAILSFFTSPGVAIILAVVAVVFGLIGVMLSLSPRTRGGIASSFAIVAGAIGMIAAIFRAIIWLAS